MSQFEATYILVAQTAYLVCLLTMLAFGLRRTAGLLSRATVWRRRLAGTRRWGVLALLAAAGSASFLAAEILHRGSGAFIAQMMLINLLLMALITVFGWSFAFRPIPKRWEPGHWKYLLAGSFAIVLMLAVMLPLSPYFEVRSELFAAVASNARLHGALACYAVFAAVAEEVLFRGALWRAIRVRTRSNRAAVWATSILFTLGHAGILAPLGVKETQILILALILASARLRLGLGGCILLHLQLNLLTVAFDFLTRTSI